MIKFSDLKYQNDNNFKEVEYGENKIQILNYLPMESKYNIIMIALQNSLEEGYYNPLKLYMYFHLYLVYYYTDIEFSNEDKNNEWVLFDKIVENGLLDLVITNMDENEYNNLYDLLEETKNEMIKYNSSIVGLLNEFANSLNKNSDSLKDILQSFNPNDYQNVIDFAKAANGGREIKE